MSERVKYLLSSEVAELFEVSCRTPPRWANEGKISSLKTPGGHNRFPVDEIEALIRDHYTESYAGKKLREMAAMIERRQGDELWAAAHRPNPADKDR